MTEADQINEFVRLRGVKRCPTAAVAPTTASLPGTPISDYQAETDAAAKASMSAHALAGHARRRNAAGYSGRASSAGKVSASFAGKR